MQAHYLLALTEHGSVVPICLDDTELPGALKPYCAIRGAGALAPEALACLLEASVSGRRLLAGPRLEVMDIPWGLGPAEPLEVLVLHPHVGQPVQPKLLKAVLDRVAQRPGGRPALLLCPHGAAPGAAAGEIAMLMEEHCPPDTAVVVGFDSLPYNEIPDRQQVQPGGDATTAWPVTAVWAGGPPFYQVDLGAPVALARVGPRIPIFRTPTGFTFTVLPMAPTPADPPGLAGTLAGLFSAALCAIPNGPGRLDLCLLLTPDAAWESPANEPLLQGAGACPVQCGTVISHTAPYLETAPCLYRVVLDPASGRLEQFGYALLAPGGALGPDEPALPLRQLVKRFAPSELPPLPYCAAVQDALRPHVAAVRSALLDGITEERRAAILALLHLPHGHDGQSPDGIAELAQALANLSLGGELDLAAGDDRHTALWASRTLIAILRGSRNARPSHLVADYCSRLYQQDERAEFSPYGNSVVLLEHFGVCERISIYHPTGFDEEFTVTEDLRKHTAPAAPGFRYCGLDTLQTLMERCADGNAARDRLKEVG